MALSSVSLTQCVVEVYPFEGGQYSIKPGQILSCTVNRNIRAAAGTFQINLAPGGPMTGSYGTSSGLSWLDIITPISFVLIGMARGNHRQIVMIGVVTHTTESQQWAPNGQVRRGLTIEGQDFAYFFNSFNYVALSFLGLSGTQFTQALGLPNVPSILMDELLQGTPDEMGKKWYQDVMDGPNGILAKTVINWNNQRLSFSDVLQVWFEKWPEWQIPFGMNFIAAEGSWTQKFKAMFEWPLYEFFVITAKPGFYENSGNDYNKVSTGKEFTISGFDAAVPTCIARLNPRPYVKFKISEKGGSGGSSVGEFGFGGSGFQLASSDQIGDLNTTAWDGLPEYTSEFSFIESSVYFTDQDVRNFYIVNPAWVQGLNGVSGNASIINFIYVVPAADDPASIHRFGYRPEYHTTNYFSDYGGMYAAGGNKSSTGNGTTGEGTTGGGGGGKSTQMMNSYGDLLARICGYYEPTALMLNGTVQEALRPDIMPGCKFKFNPFKNEESWTFYIEGVQHHFTFGGPSMTSLSLTRGLPTTIYGQDKTLLKAIQTGTATRKDGKYVAELPSEPGGGTPEGLKLLDLGSQDQVDQAMSDLGKIWSTAQLLKSGGT